MEHWRRWLPARYRSITDPEAFFSMLGQQAESQILDLAEQLEGPDPPGEGYPEKVGRLNMARKQAQEWVLREVILLANAEGIDLNEEDLAEYLAILSTFPDDATPSMGQDRRNRRPSEVEMFAGTVIRLAKKHGTGIAAENLLIIGTIQPIIPFYCSDYGDLVELVDYFNDPDMQICWDTGHANLMRFDQATALKYIGNRLKCTHIHNNFHRDDEHLTVDQGDIPWQKVMKALKEIGYDGPLTLETHCRYFEPELLKSFAAHNFKTLEYLEGLMEK
jgi:sugar phosphate isomerase/epimerase